MCYVFQFPSRVQSKMLSFRLRLFWPDGNKMVRVRNGVSDLLLHSLAMAILFCHISISSVSLTEAPNQTVSSSCIPQLIRQLSSHENGCTLDFIIFSSKPNVTLSQLSRDRNGVMSESARSDIVLSIDKISSVQFKSLAESERILVEKIPDILSTDKFNNLRILVDDVDESSVLELLKLVALLDRVRFSMSRKRHSPEVYVLWPNHNATVEELKDKIRTSSASSEYWPSMASLIYLVLPPAPTSATQSRDMECRVYEFYTILNEAHDFVLNQVEQPGGNYVQSRTDFRQTTLRVTAAAANMTTFTNSELDHGVVMRKRDMPEFLISTGTCVDVLHYLQHIFNFSIKVVPASSFISLPRDNVSWTGIGKLLLDQSVDLSIDQSIHVSYRAQYFTLLLPIFSDRVSVYFRQPSVNSVKNIFIMPFSSEIWAFIAAQFFIYLGVLLILRRLGRKKKIDPGVLTRNNFLLLTSFITIQGWHRQPKQTWVRIVFFVGSATGLILFNAYSAKLVSFFATPPIKPIDTLEKYLQSPRRVYAQATSPYWEAIFHGHMPGNNARKLEPIDFAGGINAALQHSTTSSPGVISFSYNFYPEAARILRTLAEKYFCDEISEVPILQSPFKLGMVVPKNSPLKEYFNSRIVQIHESGLLSRTRKYYIHSYKPICLRLSAGEAFANDKGLGLADVYSAFVMFFIGACISMVVLGYEKMGSWFKKRYLYQPKMSASPRLRVRARRKILCKQ